MNIETLARYSSKFQLYPCNIEVLRRPSVPLMECQFTNVCIQPWVRLDSAHMSEQKQGQGHGEAMVVPSIVCWTNDAI